MTNLVNLTPHPLTLIADNGSAITVPVSGTIARVTSTASVVDTVDVGVDDGEVLPIIETSWGDVENLPDPQPDTMYIVSSLVLSRVPDRGDVVAPDGFLRDADGKIIGATALRR